MHYYKGASLFETKNVGQGELLQWEAIKWAKNRGVKYYDLCVLDSDRLPHIAKFKMGFSMQLLSFEVFTKRSLSFRILNRIRKLFL